jgi:carboxyl-terminal processing protease
MKGMTRYIIVFGAGFIFGIGLLFEQSVRAERQPLPLNDLQTFSEVYGKIKSDYVESIGDKKLLRDAISGMLSGLDPHSSYLDPESFKEIQIGTEGRFGGLGIEVTVENGFVKVVTPIDDTPAARAGIKPGDIITKLDDQPVKDMSLNDAVKLMRGEPGTEITLTITREGEAKPLEFTLKRAVIRITSVRSRILEDKYGYVRVTQFQSETADALRKELNKLKKETDGPLDGLVLDLRNNPGGVLNGAVSVSDTFLRKGTIVYTKGRQQDSEIRFTATPNDYIDGAPMVVLVNGGSASASEIVAGALQDHKRAVIMGTKSFGKGSVQTILPMKNGAALKLTTARYFTPGDRSIQATGIEPDVVVEELEIAERESSGSQVRESDLSGHLTNGSADDVGKSDKERDPALSTDFQLREALNLLKGMNVVRANIEE